MSLLPNIINGQIVDQEAIDAEKERRIIMDAKREIKRKAAKRGLILKGEPSVIICRRKK